MYLLFSRSKTRLSTENLCPGGKTTSFCWLLAQEMSLPWRDSMISSMFPPAEAFLSEEANPWSVGVFPTPYASRNIANFAGSSIEIPRRTLPR